MILPSMFRVLFHAQTANKLCSTSKKSPSTRGYKYRESKVSTTVFCPDGKGARSSWCLVEGGKDMNSSRLEGNCCSPLFDKPILPRCVHVQPAGILFLAFSRVVSVRCHSMLRASRSQTRKKHNCKHIALDRRVFQ